MDEDKLTEKQRKWLAESKRIGPGPMTGTERKRLETLYAEMLPVEQQGLYDYILKTFGGDASAADEPPVDEDIIDKMSARIWHKPSEALRRTLGNALKPPRPPFAEES